MATKGWPNDVGILAMEIYFPYTYVDQAELEEFDGVSSGKYTIGLGQGKMGFCTDREDINSLAMTVVQKLVTRHSISYNDIGRLEVGTETIIDKSKSVKTALMQLFTASGNTDVEGIDTTNACYGGTSALFNAINWVESSSWDGRYALVVAADIAVYATGNARPTGGAGAVAMLIGQNAPLVMERGLRGTHMEHAYDFYKPDLMSEYPVVDGKLSIECYLNALDKCYARYRKRVTAKDTSVKHFTIDNSDAFLFHSPFCKLVQKSFARLMLNDLLDHPAPDMSEGSCYAGLDNIRSVKLEDTYFDRTVEKGMMTASASLYKQKTLPSLLVANQVGNMYTPSVYGGLASYLSTLDACSAPGKRIVLFSYGSGLASSMFSLRIPSTADTSPTSPLATLLSCVSDLRKRLDSRLKVTPAEFDASMKLRQETHHLAPYKPVGPVEQMFPDTWYLTDIDDKHRRQYACTTSHATSSNGQAS